MLTVIIAILISLGIISSENEYYELPQSEQEMYENSIVNEDIYEL